MSFSPVGLRRAAHNLRPRNGPPLTLPVYARQTQSLPLRASWHLRHRLYSDSSVEPVEPPEYLSEGEKKVFDLIKDGLRPTKLEVQDISGGCGSMYALDIVSDQFKGLPIIKQHRLVNKVLGEEMKKWHGVQLKTKAP